MYDKFHTFIILINKRFMKRNKNLKITPATHEILKKYCEEKCLLLSKRLLKRNVVKRKIYMVSS